MTGNDLLATMGREFLEQPLPTKVGIVVVALGFLYNISMTVLKGRKTAISLVLLMGLWGLALLFLFSFVNPSNLVRDKMYWWFVVHLWVEGVWELILGALLAFVLIKTTGVDREVIDKWLYLIITFALVTGILGTGHHFYFIGLPGYWQWVGSVFSALEPIPFFMMTLFAFNMVQRASANTPTRPPCCGPWARGDGLPGRRRVGLHPHPQPGQLLHPRHADHRRPRPPGLLRRLCAGGDRDHQLRHADAARPRGQPRAPRACGDVELLDHDHRHGRDGAGLTGAGILQVWLQRMPTEGAMGFMATQDQLRFFYWVRVAGGVGSWRPAGVPGQLLRRPGRRRAWKAAATARAAAAARLKPPAESPWTCMFRPPAAAPAAGPTPAFYAAQGGECALFEHAFQARLPLLIKGPTGCGKTRLRRAHGRAPGPAADHRELPRRPERGRPGRAAT
jgi:nitric oxide reductase subunit B